MLVVDASVLAPALGDDDVSGDTARQRLLGEELVAPDLIDLEVASTYCRQLAAGALSARRAELALIDLAELPMRRITHRTLVGRCWELRHSVTIYDAAYVALAELLDATLVTADARLGKAPGSRCHIEVLR